MKIVPDDGEFRDGELHEVLSAEYAAPSGDYWATLERRIMARIRNEGVREWWSYLAAWSRAGLAAAALALLAAGIAAWQAHKTHESIAVGELLEVEELSILSEPSGAASTAKRREATLRYLIAK